MKICKKMLILIILAVALVMSFPVNAKQKTNALTLSNEKFIYTPTSITSRGDTVFMYDAKLGKIKAISMLKRQDIAQADCPSVISLYYKNTVLYALSQNLEEGEESIKLTSYIFNGAVLIKQREIELFASIQSTAEQFVRLVSADIFASEGSLTLFAIYEQDSSVTYTSGKILKLSLNITTDGETPIFQISSLENLVTNAINLDERDKFYQDAWVQICAVSATKVYISNTTSIFEIAEGENVQKAYPLPNEENDITINKFLISPSGAFIFAQSDGVLSHIKIQETISGKTKTITTLAENLNITDICEYHSKTSTSISKLFVLNTSECEIKQIELNPNETTKSETMFFSNNFFEDPTTVPTSKDAVFMQTKEDVELLKKPYNQTADVMIESGSKVLVLSSEQTSFKNYTYCMFATTSPAKNHYGYIETSKLENINFSTESCTIYAEKGAKISKFPSLANDDKNPYINSGLSKKTAITLLSPDNYAIYSKNKNIIMLKVKINNQIGFIKKELTEEYSPSNAELISTNTKITKEVIVFEDREGITATDITLNKGDRVYTTHRIEYNKQYTKVRFNNANGVEIEGYVLTSALKKDGLSTLQITGITLLTLNLIFLGIIYGVKKKVAHD